MPHSNTGPRRAVDVHDGLADRRKSGSAEPQAVIWVAEPPVSGSVRHASVYCVDGSYLLDRRRCVDTARVLGQLLGLAQKGVIDGLVGSVILRGSGHHLIVTGSAYRYPIYATGAVQRLRALLDEHPIHPSDLFR